MLEHVFAFSVTCPHCGNDVEAVEIGPASERRTSALVRCSSCAAEERVTVTLHRVRAPGPTAPGEIPLEPLGPDDAPPFGIPRPVFEYPST